jgi:hypothetical protein
LYRCEDDVGNSLRSGLAGANALVCAGYTCVERSVRRVWTPDHYSRISLDRLLEVASDGAGLDENDLDAEGGQLPA